MRYRKRSAFIFVLMLSCSVIFSHGKKDTEEKIAENMSSWQETFDINGHKKGKYNIFITATDLGGNKAIEGPYNLFIDPKSDLPVSGITNPHQDMRVVGNLNIVGTCIDDDAVDHVELILDGDEEHPIRAQGKEFWSYYLDTRELEEGLHSIKVIGYDINGLKGNPVSLTWNLDRRQPQTKVENPAMGSLVSGTVKFSGFVRDGNGIKKLMYSVDEGRTFKELKLKQKKDGISFELSVDTKKVKPEGGPAVLWFKALDNAGSEGIYSFLYVVDNAKPELKIVYPIDFKMPQFGKFVVAGVAKDDVGLTKLEWEFGPDKGEFELVPGNPYWGIVLDSTKIKETSRKFTIRATDAMNNVSVISQVIKFNQELDKPVVTITEPNAQTLASDTDEVFVRGYASDEDGIKSVRYSLDGGSYSELETKGAFYAKLLDGKDLSSGKHSITVIAKDRNGVEGNPVTVDFMAQGSAPVFSELKVQGQPFTDGMTIHPESNSSISGSVSSGSGLTHIHYELKWGKNGIKPFDLDLNASSSASFSIPIVPDGPKGVVQLIISATDAVGRTTNYKSNFYVTNTTDVRSEIAKVIFSDSTVSPEGVVIVNKEFPVSGFLTGGVAKSVELVPKSNFVKARLSGNSIILDASDAVGQSEPTIVRVTTTQGRVIDSQELIFKNDTVVPRISINGGNGVLIDASPKVSEEGDVIPSGTVKISGSVKCSTGINSLRYRIFSIKPVFDKGIIKSVPAPEKSSDFELEVKPSFEFEFNPENYPKGLYIIEITAASPSGNKSSEAVMIRNIDANTSGKASKAPGVYWIDSENVYSAVLSQDNLSDVKIFDVYKRGSMKEGSNELQVSFNAPDGKAVLSKYTANKQITLNAAFAKIGSSNYVSGMTVPVEFGSNPVNIPNVVCYIDTGAQVSGATYEISGEMTPGGLDKSSGSAKVSKLEGSDTRWVAEFPLVNIPARITTLKLSIKAGAYSKDIIANIRVVRPEDAANTDDRERIFPMETGNSYFDKDTLSYVMKASSKFNFYANVPGPLQNAYLLNPKDGLSVDVSGKNISITCEKDGTYEDVVLKVTDANGASHTSEAVKFMVDSGAPEVNISSPELNQWVRKSVKISGTAQDPSGIKSADYSIDNGETWIPLNLNFAGKKNSQGATFSATSDIAQAEDGIIKIDVRVFDMAGQVRYARTAAFKDTTPPNAEIILPSDSDIVNGDTTILFKVTDNGSFEKSNYIAPPVAKSETVRIPVEPSKYLMTHIGTAEKPISDAMSFEFLDGSNNRNVMEAWKFNIDSESDLPRVEIHLPTYEEVITKDFTISGVVRDDDGPCKIFWRIDKNEYRELPEMGTSFAIDVDFDTLTDNEHIINVYAVDINGVKGNIEERKFKVSTEEPKGSVDSPSIDIAVKDVITVRGVTSDKNGIEKVLVSLDNGNSYNDAVGTTNWSYTFDTHSIPNGTQVVFLKVIDKYGIEGLYSSLINIDNESPEMALELPLDYSSTVGPVFFSGNVFDNVNVTDLYVSVRSFDNKPISSKMSKIPFKKDNIITQVIDLSSLENGVYNLELTALDKAGNATHVSRNIRLDKNKALAAINLLYPLNGEHKNGIFNIYGEVNADKPVETVSLYIDDKYVTDTTLHSTGYFKFNLTPELISTGVHKYRVDVRVEGGSVIKSREQTIDYSSVGPWVTIDNFDYGDFAIERPFIRGHGGYSLDEDELLLSKTKKASKEEKERIAQKTVDKVEISFDNGKTFEQISKKEKWMYQVENFDLKEGYHFMLVRATMKNGETAIERTIIQIDNTAPNIKLISPSEGGKYNQELAFSGLSNDKIGLKEVKLSLRKGDKSSYEVPKFIQGLYLDWKFWGATLFDIGAGLTFFDDNVKLQFQWGQFTQAQRNLFSLTQSRYGGDNVMGIKILANVASIPFSFFFGRDWEIVSASVAIGANFTYFNETNSGKPQILSALLLQLELPKFTFKKMKMFSAFSFYTEASLWFIPTDVSSNGVDIKNLVPQISEGIRLNVF